MDLSEKTPFPKDPFFRTRLLTRVSNPRLGSTERWGLERGWQKRLAKGWQTVGTGWAKGRQRVGGFPCTLQLCNSRGARLEDWVCDSMVQSQSLAPSTPAVDMEKMGKLANHIYRSDYLACQGHFREEGSYGGGRYSHFPSWVFTPLPSLHVR